MSPDIENVSLIGFTRKDQRGEHRTTLTRSRDKIRIIPKATQIELVKTKAEDVSVIGKLDYADANKMEIHLTADDNSIYKIIVPNELLCDIVRPHWEDIVHITGKRVADKIYLEDIKKEE